MNLILVGVCARKGQGQSAQLGEGLITIMRQSNKAEEEGVLELEVGTLGPLLVLPGYLFCVGDCTPTASWGAYLFT